MKNQTPEEEKMNSDVKSMKKKKGKGEINLQLSKKNEEKQVGREKRRR